MRGEATIKALIRPEGRLYGKYRDFTMVPRWRFMDNLDLAATVEVAGDIVECGSWKGGMVAAIAELLREQERRVFVFDSFEGLPLAREDLDGPSAVAYQADTDSPAYLDNCAATELEAGATIRMSGIGDSYSIRKGWFEDTVPVYAASDPEIALLRLDGDWYESTIVCLRSLYPLVVPGGLILVDDYGTWDGCTRAVHDYLAEVKAPEDIRRSPNGVAYLLKR